MKKQDIYPYTSSHLNVSYLQREERHITASLVLVDVNYSLRLYVYKREVYTDCVKYFEGDC